MPDSNLIEFLEYLRRRNGDKPSPTQGIRLIDAFLRIADSQKREQLIAMAEQMAASDRGATAD